MKIADFSSQHGRFRRHVASPIEKNQTQNSTNSTRSNLGDRLGLTVLLVPLATSHIDGHVTTWRVTPEKLVAGQVHTFDLLQSAFAVLFSPGGEYLLASCQDGSIYRWETISGKPTGTYPGESGSLLVLALDLQGSTLVAGSLEGKLVFWRQ